jgi:hypothetical protein
LRHESWALAWSECDKSGAVIALTLSAEFMSAGARRQSGFALLLAEQLAQIFDKAQNHNTCRPSQSDKEQNREQMHGELQDSGHEWIVPHHTKD